MEQYDSRVDAYIAKSAEFAKPILEYIRDVVHEASPLITETIKWGFPFFDYKGPVCNMSAFKQHIGFGFWKASLLNDPHQMLRFGDEKAGSFGDIKSVADLPPKEIIIDFVQQAITFNEMGVKVPAKKVPVEKTELVIPDYFIKYLAKDPKAKEIFDKFSYSHKKEYAEWIVDAKSETTREKRMETALEWISEGKSRNWKYKV
ncbi:MAG TPA: YdeI/OmpD-associated family protein [Mucilaginibacter sp.]|jgi:uncharacterized protein YdeI (YjbR/CyaY-like superfamily)